MMIQQQYNEAINLIGHLILTAGDSLRLLLEEYGVSFSDTPSRSDLIDTTVEMLGSHSSFAKGLALLIDTHIDQKGASILALRKSGFDMPDLEDDFFGGLIKGAIGAIGGLLKKKKNRNRNSGGGGNISSSQANQAKRDLELQIQRMREEQRRREEELRRERERIRQEQEAQRKAMEEKAKRRTQTMLFVGGGLVVATLIGVMVFKMHPPAPTI